MAVNAPVQIDRQRIQELIEREEKRAQRRDAEVGARCTRARTRCSRGGVASSYQLRDPWPIYLERGDGPKVWDVDGNEMSTSTTASARWSRATRTRRSARAIQERYAQRHALRRPDRGRDRRRRGARSAAGACRAGATRTPAPSRRWTRSGSRAPTRAATP